MGRQSEFTQDVADAICERIAQGESLRAILKDDDAMPASSTVFKWLNENESFSEQYARAREAQADVLFDEILTIADDGRNDSYFDEEGNQRTDHDVIARSKLRVDARKWMAGKLRPKKYGEKLAIGGADDLPPLQAVSRIELIALGDNSTDRTSA